MCIRDRPTTARAEADMNATDTRNRILMTAMELFWEKGYGCLLYTSDAADERSSVDLGGRRIIKKKKSAEIDEWEVTNKQETKNTKGAEHIPERKKRRKKRYAGK